MQDQHRRRGASRAQQGADEARPCPSRNRRKYGKQQRKRKILAWAPLAVCVSVCFFSLFNLLRFALQTHETRAIQAAHLELLDSVQAQEALTTSASVTAASISEEDAAAAAQASGTQYTLVRTASAQTEPSQTETSPTELSPTEIDQTEDTQATAQPMATAAPTATPGTAAVQASVLTAGKPTMLSKYNALYAENEDLIGWLNVDSLYRINFAVVQGNNDFYMDHDFDKRANVNGAAFLDETCSIWPRDDNLLIYAHNMKSGDMFGELNKMQSEALLREDPIVHFSTLYEEDDYIPIAVFSCSVVQADDYFQFYVRNFKTESAFDSYIERARALSTVRLDTDVQYGDQLLTLITCYDSGNTKRFVVLLRKLRADESAEDAQSLLFADEASAS